MYWEQVDSTEEFSCTYHMLLFIQSCRGRGKNKLEREIFCLNPGVTFHPYLNSEALDSCSLPLLNVFCFNFHDAILLPFPSPCLIPFFPVIFGGSLNWFSHLFLTLPCFLWISSPTTRTSPSLPTLPLPKSVSLRQPISSCLLGMPSWAPSHSPPTTYN